MAGLEKAKVGDRPMRRRHFRESMQILPGKKRKSPYASGRYEFDIRLPLLLNIICVEKRRPAMRRPLLPMALSSYNCHIPVAPYAPIGDARQVRVELNANATAHALACRQQRGAQPMRCAEA